MKQNNLSVQYSTEKKGSILSVDNVICKVGAVYRYGFHEELLS